jgi:hypothetical protein
LVTTPENYKELDFTSLSFNACIVSVCGYYQSVYKRFAKLCEKPSEKLPKYLGGKIMLAIKKDSKWLDNIGHICTVLNVPEDQEDLTKMMQYQYQVEYQRKNKKIISWELKSFPMYRFLDDMTPLNDVVNDQL